MLQQISSRYILGQLNRAVKIGIIFLDGEGGDSVSQNCKNHFWKSFGNSSADPAPLSFVVEGSCTEMYSTHVCFVLSFVCYTLRYLQFYTVSKARVSWLD